MLFNSQAFFFFIVIVFLSFWLVDSRLRKYILLLASYIFYAFSGLQYIALLFSVTFLSHIISKLIINSKQNALSKKMLLSLGLLVLFIPLIYFKYFNFISSNLNSIFDFAIPLYKIVLPVGISFYTFQTAGYLIDCYKNKKEYCESFINFALYVSFFPQLVAGPIERASNLIPQLKKNFTYKYSNLQSGLKIALWGFFKKIVIADNLAQLVNLVFSRHDSFDGLFLLFIVILFAFQIYCDFSGYSDIAIGVARVFDIRLMKNFDRPYFAKSIEDFWRRWHISLSTWFKDYLYIPLGGNRTPILFWCMIITIVFGLSGLWHGAKWTFIIWGLVHAVAFIASRLISPIYEKTFIADLLKSLKLDSLLYFVLTFSFVNLSWLFFRSESLDQALEILNKIIRVNLFDYNFALFFEQLTNSGFDIYYLFKISFVIIILFGFEAFQEKSDFVPSLLNHSNVLIRRSIQYLVLLLILTLGYFGSSSQFIYFQF